MAATPPALEITSSHGTAKTNSPTPNGPLNRTRLSPEAQTLADHAGPAQPDLVEMTNQRHAESHWTHVLTSFLRLWLNFRDRVAESDTG